MTKTKATESSEDTRMGFKDKQKALDTLKVLDGRDISYQYHVITSFVSRVKRTLQITRDEEKLANLKEALQVFEDWLKEYKAKNRGKENLAYLSLETVRSCRGLAERYGVLDDEFYRAYAKEKGDYKALRSVKVPDGETTWDIERNRRLKEIINKVKQEYIQWYETDVGDFRGLPSKEHIRCIMLAYSPDPSKLKKLVAQVEEKFSAATEMEIDEQQREEKGVKRAREGSASSGSSEENEPSPRKMAKRSEEEQRPQEDRGPEEESGGLGFKNKEKALQSIKSLEGRDVRYQYHAITGLVKRAERVIACTKDEAKIGNMREAVEVFENWITDYNVNGRAAENFDYLPADVVRGYKPLADKYKIEDNKFLEAYEEVGGDYKKLRAVRDPGADVTWDIERNRRLREALESVKGAKHSWYEEDGELAGLPSELHTRCIMWAFSHDPAKLRKLLPSLEKLKS